MNIIVNGASKGIGRALVLRMAADKDKQIIATGRNESMLRELQMECLNGNVTYMKMDITEMNKEMEVIRDQIFNRFSSVDILINMSGSLIVSDFMKLSDNDTRNMMETNFFGPVNFIKLVVPLMPAGSHIVNISSMGGFQGSSKYRGLAVYSASKAAISCFSECLAVELSESGISVNCLALGSVQTGMFEKAFPGFKAPVSPEGMAEFISYFAVNGNKFFNGKVLPVAVNNP